MVLLKIRIYGSDKLKGAQTTSVSLPYLSPLSIDVLEVDLLRCDIPFSEGPHAYVVLKKVTIDESTMDREIMLKSILTDVMIMNWMGLMKWPILCYVCNCSC